MALRKGTFYCEFCCREVNMIRILGFLGLLVCAEAQLSSLFGLNNCDNAIDKISRNSDICALLYDDDGCNGWEQIVRRGSMELEFSKKRDAEAVVVRPGCVLIGHDEEASDTRNSVPFDASKPGTREALVIKNLSDDQLDEEIEYVDCYCPAESGVEQVLPITSTSKVKAGFLDTLRGKDSVKKCNTYVPLFNR